MMPAACRLWRALACAACLLTITADARAQPSEPIGPFAVDVRVVMPRFKENADVAASLGVAPTDLPASGLGLGGGVHFYPVRRRVALGIGGEILFAGGSKSREADEDTPGSTAGPVVDTRLRVISPQVSLNFGTGRGWSYLTGGFGWGSFTTEREDDPVGSPASRPTVLNYGGGARWFAKEHVAFAVDLRFYAIGAQEAAIGRPAYPSMTLMVLSAGVSFK